jgi:hypothetical protein
MFGYSPPDADVLSRRMLKTALRQNAVLECVDCINPGAATTPTLRQVLDTKVVRLYADAKSFVTFG